MTSPLQEVMSYVGTGNADPILREIRFALAKLVETGEPTVIDLGAIPFAAGDERILDKVLGRGELQATLTSMGESRIAETGVAGVWRVDHFDADGEVQSRFIEVTYMPEILRTQKEDAAYALARLDEMLNERAEARAQAQSGVN
ncbi:hydrogenase expression/formation C-terminal domain-containing protein [Alisedimentitalea sp. MJ-SS2]|uniref:hydrogenase expression/formation C-terminal domain-containing protein n=1 Tax=Aliisedimentitalea sp. MJ-SS2 TaxID=3049795 RepID=UPI00290682EE|nr:hydrogenase expression/formation C-terminal domain-containing protein [Alisedimentitalea sp. MJ-SS2]MDU8925768.1 hydrogenase expression/formation C-terminal domain-containing protein [Alisedimentitalea sp. MJ-SS2]